MVHGFCWVDLAASEADTALAFYGSLFGWTALPQSANGGVFTRLRAAGRDIGSLYQLQARQLAAGVPSHWTPYVRVDDVDGALARTAALGGSTMVQPFLVPELARIAVIVDPVGAPIGLWQPAGGKGQ